jgi:hypothetical protein
VNPAAVSSGPYYPIDKYVLRLVQEGEQKATVLRIGERGILRVDTIFGSSLESLNAMVEREASTVVLVPKS